MLQAAAGPWWIIAEAAVALHARWPVAVDDVDILLEMEDVALIRDLPAL